MMAAADPPSGDRDRLTLHRRTLDERRAGLAETLASIERLAGAEEDEIAKALRAAPTQKVFKLGSPAQRARTRREKLVASIPSLEAEIAALERIVAAEEVARSVEEIRAATTQANALRKAELESWRKAGELQEALHDAWRDVVEHAEALDQLHALIMQSEAATLGTDEDVLAAFEKATKPPIQPFPASYERFRKRLADVAEGIYECVGVPTDHEHRLEGLIGRFTSRSPRLSGRVSRS